MKDWAAGLPVLRAVRAAGVEPWPRTFHALRASCETDWAAVHPIADVAAWMGHSRVVAARHCLRATDTTFAAITGRNGGVTGGDNSVKKVVTPVVMRSAASRGTERREAQESPVNHGESASSRRSKHHGAAPYENL